MSFAIITDSTSDISPARAQELGIYVIPLHVIIEGEDLLDQVQITAEEYVARMAGSEQLPHTSQPSAGEFKAALRSRASRRPRQRHLYLAVQ